MQVSRLWLVNASLSRQVAGIQGRKADPGQQGEGGPDSGACGEPSRVSSRTQVPPNPSPHEKPRAQWGSSWVDVGQPEAPRHFQGDTAFASGQRGASLVVQLVKNLPANAGDPGLIPGLGRSPGKGNGYPFQYQFSSVQSLSHVRLFVTPWMVAHQAPRILEWVAYPFSRGSS